jgi:putative transferase (TIGR04331 family)
MFLATTPIDSFWDKSDKIIFLGEWCKLYENKQSWNALQHETMPYPWNNRRLMFEAQPYLSGIFEDLLTELSIILNQTFTQKHSSKYWRIIIGPWLLSHIQIFYERYICIKQAIELYPLLKTYGLSDSDFTIPADFWEYFHNVTNSDRYNLQIYTSILDGLNFQHKKFKFKNAETSSNGKRNSMGKWYLPFVRKVVLILGRVLSFVAIKFSPVILVDIYLPRKLIYKLIINSKFKCSWYIPNSSVHFDRHTDENIKVKIRRTDLGAIKISKNDEFQRILIDALPLYFPKTYFEDYIALSSAVFKTWKRRAPRVLITANAILGNEYFKFLAAFLSTKKGTKIIGVQHGGNYGSALINTNEIIETEIADWYWTWGWVDNNSRKKALSNPKLSLISKRHKEASVGKKYILYIGNDFFRYFYRIWSCPIASQGLDYINLKIQFLENLTPENRKILIYRPFPTSSKWDTESRIRNKFRDLKMDNIDNYYHQLEAAALVVCDTNQTSFLESLVANIPTIAFWNPDHWEIRSNAKPFFDLLYEVGILHKTPKEAAEAINANIESLNDWWQSPNTQKVRCKFVSQFARNSHSWEKEWLNEIGKYY